MSNKEKYDQVFIESFSVNQSQLNQNFVYQCVPEWDSVGHMGMIAGLESSFDIMMETDDIIDAYKEFDGLYTEEELRLMRIRFMSEVAN